MCSTVQCLGMTATNLVSFHEDVKRRLHSENACYNLVQKYLCSPVLRKYPDIKILKTQTYLLFCIDVKSGPPLQVKNVDSLRTRCWEKFLDSRGRSRVCQPAGQLRRNITVQYLNKIFQPRLKLDNQFTVVYADRLRPAVGCVLPARIFFHSSKYSLPLKERLQILSKSLEGRLLTMPCSSQLISHDT
jgi:hypothetical protein